MTPEKLAELAVEAMNHAYVPYSGYKVGAALLCADGTVYQGCNIENASYSPTVCAERTAFFKAVYDGHRDFTAIAVCGGKDGVITGPFPPCGVCRQVMREFCQDDFIIYLVGKDGSIEPVPCPSCCPTASPPKSICTNPKSRRNHRKCDFSRCFSILFGNL